VQHGLALGNPGYPNPTPLSDASGSVGAVNTGGGGGSGGHCTTPSPSVRIGNSGGSGVVVVVEPAGCKTETASGVWSLQEQYDAEVAGTWPT